MSASHPETVIGLFADRATKFRERPFVSQVRGGRVETMSYAESAARVVGMAETLRGLGYGKGDRIACFLDEGEPGLWFYLACGAIGVLPVPLGPSYSIDALWQLAAQSGAKAVFTTRDRVQQLQGKLPVLSAFDGGAAVPGATVLAPAPVAAPIDRLNQLAAAITPDDLFMLQPTSGSTGVPKLVMRRNITFPRSGRVIAAGLEPGAPESGLLAQALTHGGGHYCLNVALYLGGQLCIPSAIDTAITIEEVEAMAPTFLYVAPRILRSFYQQHLARHGAGGAFCGGRLRWVFVGGGVPDEEILSWVERGGAQVLEGYGATEVSMVAMTERGRRKAGSAGRLLDDVEVRIADDGEIRVKTRFGMAGYLNDEALTRDAFDADGYYLTGDLGKIEDGTLQLQGRKRDVFNSSEGSNIYPVRIEEMIESLPWVDQVMLVGDMKPFLTALIVPKKTGDADALYPVAAADLARVNERVEGFERIRRFALMPARFDEAIYRVVGQAKVRRDRKRMLAEHADLIARLYGAAVDARMEVHA